MRSRWGRFRGIISLRVKEGCSCLLGSGCASGYSGYTRRKSVDLILKRDDGWGRDGDRPVVVVGFVVVCFEDGLFDFAAQAV